MLMRRNPGGAEIDIARNGSSGAVKEVMEYIRTDQRETAQGRFLRIQANERGRHHFETVTQLIKDLRAKGWIAAEIEPGLHYVVISCEAPEEIIPQAFEFLDSTAQQRVMLDVNDHKGAVLGYYPFPLSMRDAASVFRFYSGKFVISIFVRISCINQIVAVNNIRTVPTGKGWEISPLEPHENWGERYVMPRAVGQLAGEFLSLRWFIDNILLGPIADEMTKLFKEQAAQTAS